MKHQNTLEYARQMDAADSLNTYRNQFHHPTLNGAEARYFCGNSLGLQPKAVRAALHQELDDWATHAVEGHFKAKHPWFSYQDMFAEPIAHIVGALPMEVTVMNALTVNLHLMMVSFYRPQGKRIKIICEAKAFPSDQYAIESQVRFHELDPKDATDTDLPAKRDHHYGFINYTSILSADKAFFNSEYHLRSFLSALPAFVDMFPDFREKHLVEKIHTKSEVLHLGLN